MNKEKYVAMVVDRNGTEWVYDIVGDWFLKGVAMPRQLSKNYALRKCKQESKESGTVKSYRVIPYSDWMLETR